MTNAQKWYSLITDDNKSKIDKVLEDYAKVLKKDKDETLEEAFKTIVGYPSERGKRPEKYYLIEEKEREQNDTVRKAIRDINEHIENIKNDHYALALAHSGRQPAHAAEITGLHPKYKFNRKFLETDKGEPGVLWYFLEEGKVYAYKESREMYYIKIVDLRPVGLTEEQVKEIFKNK